MKKELIKIIKIIGINYKEIIMDIKIGDIIYNTIEYVEPDTIILHSFYEKVDIETNWSELNTIQRKEILKYLKPFLYN